MSLFPAYSGGDSPKPSTSKGNVGDSPKPSTSKGNVGDSPKPSTSKDNIWLSNDSFNAGPLEDKKKQVEDAQKYFRECQKKRNKAKKMKLGAGEKDKVSLKKRRKKLGREDKESEKFCENNPAIEQISNENDLYFIDKTRRMDFLICSTLTRPIKPRYFVPKKNFIGPVLKEPDKKIFRRYFMRKIPCMEKPTNEEKAIKLNEEYNKKLCKDSSVAEWIEFVEFQDEFFVSQNVRYDTGKDRQTAIMKKKLHILEKAMHFNPGNEELLSYWMKIANEALSTDEMLKSLDSMIKDAPANLPLWLSYISVTQQSMSRCTFLAVTESYKKGMNCFKSKKVDDIAKRDSDILDLLFHYCKFLQDSGHWELLWTILKTNINLNFGICIDIDLGITDLKVKRLEDEIIYSESHPIWVTWRMMETLREGYHFLPVLESEYYPQRCVPLDDLFNFVLHFHPDVHLKLIIKFLMLLKVPPLPFNTTITKALFGTRLLWALDYPELYLSTAFNAPTSDVQTNYLKFTALLPVGPQYLRNLEGQKEFFELIQKVFFEFMRVVNPKQKIFLGLWWLRFNRWIYILNNNSLAKLQIPTKKIKNFFKDFIRNPENRDNLLYYCEYSLFESIQGNVEESIKILKTLISVGQSVYQFTDNLKKAAFCQVHRILCEQYIQAGQIEEARKVLIGLALGPSPDTKADSLKLALNKYENDMVDLVQNILVTPNSLEEILLPQFSLEWIHCYLWLLALNESAVRAKTLYMQLDAQFKREGNLFSNYAREYLCEAVAIIFWMMEKPNSLALIHVIKDGLMQYPENLKILSLVASKKIEDHGLWLTFKQSFLHPPTIFGCVTLISLVLLRLQNEEESLENRLNHLLRQLSADEGKLSSMVQRLRLMYLFDRDQSQLEAAQVHAIASCPWSKRVYTSAITVLPSKLVELADVMVEKDLRIHVTPDEIVEMRD